MNQITIDFHKAALDGNYVLLLTSNEKEKEAVNSIIQDSRRAVLKIANRGCYVGRVGGFFVIHLSGTSGISQADSISRAASEFLKRTDYPKPSLVVLVGFCWGDPSKVEIGQTLVSTRICSINKSVSTPKGIKYSSTEFNSPISVCVESLREAVGSSSDFKLSTMASLETLLTSTVERNNIIDQFPEVAGGEMEAFGLIPSITGVPWLIIKTVSDYGCDSFERLEQSATADISASLAPKIINAICDSNGFSFSQASDECLCLLDALTGNSIAFRRSDFNSDNLNDVLNNEYGPVIQRKLSSYCSSAEYDIGFSYAMCDLLLEMVQNSFKHNKSKALTLRWNQTSIVLSEDNDAYDVSQISGVRGGAQAWKYVNDRYITSGGLIYRVNRKSHVFSLSKIDSELVEAKRNCTAVVKESAIGSPFGHADGVLVFNTSCNSVYVDSTRIYMRSRAISIVEDIRGWLSKGIVIYLSCRTEEDAGRYKEYISDKTGLLRVFVG